jgi:DNA-directed RNA polymerase specialized sigma24 family protein
MPGSSAEQCTNRLGETAQAGIVDADQLSARYLRRMERLARPLVRFYQLQPTIGADDVANDALFRMFLLLASGRYRRVTTGGDHWPLARLLVRRRVHKHHDWLNRVRRGGPGKKKVARAGTAEPATGGPCSGDETDLDLLQSRWVSAEDVAAGTMDVELQIERLRDPMLKKILRMRLDGYTGHEIAVRTRLDRSTIGRKLKQIRNILRALDPRYRRA